MGNGQCAMGNKRRERKNKINLDTMGPIMMMSYDAIAFKR